MVAPIGEGGRGCNRGVRIATGVADCVPPDRVYITVMVSGRINSPASIRIASDVVRAFGGSWEAVERASTVDADGVHVIRRSDIERARRGETVDRR